MIQMWHSFVPVWCAERLRSLTELLGFALAFSSSVVVRPIFSYGNGCNGEVLCAPMANDRPKYHIQIRDSCAWKLPIDQWASRCCWCITSCNDVAFEASTVQQPSHSSARNEDLEKSVPQPGINPPSGLIQLHFSWRTCSLYCILFLCRWSSSSDFVRTVVGQLDSCTTQTIQVTTLLQHT